MSPLTLTLFGPFEAALPGRTITDFTSDKVRALLAYLAVEADRPHRREALAGLLWSDWPEVKAKRNLRQSLHRLRQTLDSYQPKLTAQLFTINRQTIQLNSSGLQLDLLRFQAELSAVKGHLHPLLHACPPCLTRLREALALYQGELMAGFTLDDAPEFESWLALRREQFHQQTLTITAQLADAAEQNGDYRQAYDYANRQLALEPWQEEAHRQVMRLLALDGRRGEAMVQFNTCREVLVKELAVEPAPETVALYQAIRMGEVQAEPLPTVRPTIAILHHFPTQLTPFVGRQTTLQQITEQLTSPDCRLLTLTGPGGIGKTRLSIRAAEQLAPTTAIFADGLYFVSLVGVAEPELLVSTVAGALGVNFNERELPRRQLLHYLAARRLLLVLDNIEHLAGDTSLLTDILAMAPHVKLLVTSREPLNLRSEWRISLEGLAYDQASNPTRTDAGQFFLQAARRIQPSFQPTAADQQTIARICRLLEGTPLALEIAAAWLRVYDLATIAQEVTHNLDLLITPMRDLPDRHRSMRAVFEQTWQRLTPAEQQLLAESTIFHGGFDVAAAQGVLAATPLDLAALVDKALLKKTTDRYTLHELLRQFAAEKRDHDPASATSLQQRHSHYYLQWLNNRRAGLHSDAAQQLVIIIQHDLDNIRSAWQWAVEQRQLDLLLTCSQTLFNFYELTGLFEEGEALFRTAGQKLADSAGRIAEEDLALFHQACCRLGQCQALLLTQLGRLDQAMAVVASAIQSGEADQQTQAYHGAVHAYSKILALRGEYDSALCYLEQALTFFEADQDGAGQAAVLYDLGTVAWQREQAEAALEYYQTSLTIGAASHNRFHTAQCAGSIGSVYWRSYKNYGQALHWYQQALTSSRLLGYQWGIARWLGNIGLVYWKWGDYERSLTYQRQALEVYQAQGVEFQAALWQGNIGLLYAAMGDDEQALHYFEQALPIQHRLGAKFYRAEVLQAKAELLFRRQDYAAARRDNVEAMRLAANLDGTQVLFEAQLLAAKLAYATGQQTEAIRHLQSMLAGGEDFELAAIHYELWQLNGSRAHAEAALKLYQELAGHQQDVEYQKRLTRLTEVLQSDDHPKPDGSG